MDGGPTTARLAEAVPPVPPSVEVTVPVTLVIAPAAVPFTLTLRVHDPLAGNVPPERLTDVEPAVAVAVPPQVFVNPFGVATTRPPVKASVKLTPLNEFEPLGLLIVKVNDVVPFTGMLAAPKFLTNPVAESTLRVAVLLTAPAPL
jgi:hypothetical protein